jgi:hypothetical protein
MLGRPLQKQCANFRKGHGIHFLWPSRLLRRSLREVRAERPAGKLRGPMTIHGTARVLPPFLRLADNPNPETVRRCGFRDRLSSILIATPRGGVMS